MTRYAEAWRKTGAVELEEGQGYHNVTIPVTTVGGIEKLITVSESEAAWLVAQITEALDKRPAETRGATFKASNRAGGKPAPSKG